MFMLEQHVLENPPPYMTSAFTSLGRDIITMISCMIGFISNEYVDEMTFCLYDYLHAWPAPYYQV